MNPIIKKKQFKVNFVTVDQAKDLSQKDYNPNEWNKTINLYNRFENAIFYTVPGTIYKNDLYVIYTTNEGIRFRKQISYSSSLSNSLFTQCVLIDNNIHELHLKDDKGNSLGYKNDSSTRILLSNICKNNESIFYI